MHAEFEPVSSYIRVFDDGKTHGDPFEIFLGVRHIDKETIELSGLKTPLTFESARAIKDACRDMGVTRILVIRYRGGERTHHSITVKPH